MWQKVLCFLLIAVVILSAIFIMGQETKACCLCNSFRYHAPCLIDLETGELMELDLYFPHETKVAELAEPQPEMGTFSLIQFGAVTGTKQTDCKRVELTLPSSGKVKKPALCKNCRQKAGSVSGRYVLADLYTGDKNIIPICADLSVSLRCYEITVHTTENGSFRVIIQGTLDLS